MNNLNRKLESFESKTNVDLNMMLKYNSNSNVDMIKSSDNSGIIGTKKSVLGRTLHNTAIEEENEISSDTNTTTTVDERDAIFQSSKKISFLSNVNIFKSEKMRSVTKKQYLFKITYIIYLFRRKIQLNMQKIVVE